MAIVNLSTIDDQIKAVVQNLYNLIVQTYEHQGTVTEAAMKREIQSLVNNLVTLSNSAPQLPISVPPEVIQYVQEGRNPDIYTREFVEVTMRNNQKLKGKTDAFARFRDVLALELVGAVPDLRNDVKLVVESTNGSFGG